MLKLAVAVATVALAVAQSPDYQTMWEKFKLDYGKDYSANGNEEEQRFQVFKANVDIINAENAKKLSYQLGVNQFADLTAEEFAKERMGFKPANRWGDLPNVPFPNTSGEVLADSIDWVAKGAVTPVKNQAQCGSCWAFSTTGSLEGAYQIASGKLVSLSEEDLVQCDHNGDQGCQGGLMDNAFGWIKQTGGICTEADYPYTSGSGITGTCKKTCTPAVTLTGFTDVPSKDEDALKSAVAKHPVSIALEADKSAFQLYTGGVLDSPSCGTQLDHGVLIVGYGTDSGKDYWKVKNSWGADWGESGYIRIVRGKNMCGLAMQPSYPTGAGATGHEIVV